MATRTIIDQPSLFDDIEPPPVQPTISKVEKVRPRRNRRHVLDLPRPWTDRIPCTAVCLVCRRPEGLGVCPNDCSIVCGQPDRTGPVEICLLTRTIPARRLRDRAIVTCPHCHNTHWHQPAEGRAYRIGQCGHPYITTERSTP